MKFAAVARWSAGLLSLLAVVVGPARAGDPEPAALARKARDILKANCHRCHGQEGAVEGGMNYVLDLDRLLARKKIVPGHADASPLFRRVASGKMPPPGENPRPGEADVALLRRWIDAGAPPAPETTARRPFVSEAEVFARILADLDGVDRRGRRFVRYFTLTHLANAGLGEDELQTYRNALAKLLNSLSWQPRIILPQPVDPDRTILRIDLRDFVWDANTWNRILADYPYGIFPDTATARACSVATATRMPCVRADWFVATASRPPLYQDLLQLPNNAAELERQLRVDAAADIQQERVARAGFNGSGISRNNRLLERHDAVHGAYWRTYDFDAVPQNLVDRPSLLPDRRNLFAYPLGPGGLENQFQHAGGEIIFNLPNGLQGYMLVNAVNVRIDKGPVAIVSDPKRPDRAVETGVSCMNCHYRGILPKADQVRAHVDKNPQAFSRADAELIRALYVPEEKMKALMDEDAERFRRGLEKTGNRVTTAEPVMTITLRYEADVDLPAAAAEAGLPPEEFLAKLLHSEAAARNLGALKLPGGTVARQVFIQSFADVVKDFRLGLLFDASRVGQILPDNTGELDPLEAQSSPANGLAFSTDGKRALIAGADRSVRLWDVEAERDLRRFIGHTASVWSVAFSPDGSQALSGGADTTVRLWDVATGREQRKLEGHTGLVTCVAFSPDGRKALSGGYDHTVILWDLETGKALHSWPDLARYVNCVAFAPDGRRCLVGGEKALHLVDTETGKEVRRLEGHTDSVVDVAFAPDGGRALSASDDRTVRLWDLDSGRALRTFQGHTAGVKCVAFSPDDRRALSGGADQSVRLWDVEGGRELRRFAGHTDTVIRVAFVPGGGQSLSGSRDAVTRLWRLSNTPAAPGPAVAPEQPDVSPPPAAEGLRPVAVVPVGGTVGNLLLSPDRAALYYLNLTDARLGRLDLTAPGRPRELPLAEGTEAVCLTPDGTTLYAAAPDGKVQVIDPRTLEVRKTLTTSAAPYDIAATDAGLVFLTGAAGDWTEITVVDANRGEVAAHWGGVWKRSFLQTSPDQKRLYVSTQGVTPGLIEGLALPSRPEGKPAPYRSPAAGKHPLGGPLTITPDGKYLLSKTGTVLRLTGEADTDLEHAATLEPFLAAAVAPALRTVFLLTPDGGLKRYSYPDFKPQAASHLGVVAYQAVWDGGRHRLYVAGFDPASLAGRPRARGFGDIFVYDLSEVGQVPAR
jgi:WD40 repeat protein